MMLRKWNQIQINSGSETLESESMSFVSTGIGIDSADFFSCWIGIGSKIQFQFQTFPVESESIPHDWFKHKSG